MVTPMVAFLLLCVFLLLLSAGWLIYSIILMAIGIWKRARVARIGAIALFGVSILKIFIYDLSFLDTL